LAVVTEAQLLYGGLDPIFMGFSWVYLPNFYDLFMGRSAYFP
jgi:hypothetical protein